MTETIKLFSHRNEAFGQLLKEIQEQLEKHPELWDKNHPQYGKGPRFVDYITQLPPTSPKLRVDINFLEKTIDWKELARKYPIRLVAPSPVKEKPAALDELFFLHDLRKSTELDEPTPVLVRTKSRQ